MKRMSAEEFREFGYLQEINRQFLHPLGLAIEVTVDEETGEVQLHGVWDCRDDPEGIIFAEEEIDEDKARNVTRELERRGLLRFEALGYVIQPSGERTEFVDTGDGVLIMTIKGMPVLASELIEALQIMVVKYGDLPVVCNEHGQVKRLALFDQDDQRMIVLCAF